MIGITGTNRQDHSCLHDRIHRLGAGRDLRIDRDGFHPSRRALDRQPSHHAGSARLSAAARTMVDAKADLIVCEVSSHALALGRVDATRFRIGAFTNLSQDHLDFPRGDGQLLRGQGAPASNAPSRGSCGSTITTGRYSPAVTPTPSWSAGTPSSERLRSNRQRAEAVSDCESGERKTDVRSFAFRVGSMWPMRWWRPGSVTSPGFRLPRLRPASIGCRPCRAGSRLSPATIRSLS